MISEEYIEREKRLAEVYERYYDSRPELKKESDELYDCSSLMINKNRGICL